MKGRDKRKSAKANAAKRKGMVPWKKKLTQVQLDQIAAKVVETFDQRAR